MKIELNLIKNKIKKDKTWLTIYLISLLICIIYSFLNYGEILNNSELINSLIGYPYTEFKDTIIYMLFNIYRIVYFIYFSVTYVNEELDEYKDILIVREKSNKWIIKKVISIILFIIILKTINILTISILFQDIIDYKIILITLLYSITISLTGVIFNNNLRNTSLGVIISLIVSYIIFFYLKNIILMIVLLLILLILIIKPFSFKKIYKIKYN